MNHEVIFEVIPYTKNSSAASSEKFLGRISDFLSGLESVKLLNIPEIIEENHLGLPYYRNANSRKFAMAIRDRCGKEIMLNTVVVHHASSEKFQEWIDESKSCGITNFVFVGAKMESLKYPGPSIMEANSIAKSRKMNFGNIFIPEREDEARRIIAKTKSGCNFFTSQVIFEPDLAIGVISDYYRACKNLNLKPAKFFLSFAPISTIEDIHFVKWLGANIYEVTKSRLMGAQDMGEESIKIASEAFSKACGFFKDAKINVGIGLNVEYISLHNLELSKRLVESLLE